MKGFKGDKPCIAPLVTLDTPGVEAPPVPPLPPLPTASAYGDRPLVEELLPASAWRQGRVIKARERNGTGI